MESIFSARKQTNVHRDKFFVVIMRTPLTQNSSDGVAVITSMLKRIIRDLIALIAEKPVFRLPEDWLGFFRRQPVVGTEVTQDLGGLRGLNGYSIQTNHALIDSSHTSGVVRIYESRRIIPAESR